MFAVYTFRWHHPGFYPKIGTWEIQERQKRYLLSPEIIDFFFYRDSRKERKGSWNLLSIGTPQIQIAFEIKIARSSSIHSLQSRYFSRSEGLVDYPVTCTVSKCSVIHVAVFFPFTLCISQLICFFPFPFS